MHNDRALEQWERRARRARAVALWDGLDAAARRVWPTADGRPAEEVRFPGEVRVAIAGDWESEEARVFPHLRRLHRVAPDVRTVLHLGDVRWAAPRSSVGRKVHEATGFIPRLDRALAESGIDRLIVVPGNHEWWDRLHEEFADNPRRFFRVAQRIWIAPRGMRFTLGGRRYLCMGGAASLEGDRGPFEVPSEVEIDDAIAGGPADVLLTHEALNVGIDEVVREIGRPGPWAPDRRAASFISRARVTRLFEAVQPELALFGHMHVAGSKSVGDSAVHCLNAIGEKGGHHMGLLSIDDLHIAWIDDLRDTS